MNRYGGGYDSIAEYRNYSPAPVALPGRQAREEENISERIANDAKRLNGLCSSRALDGLPLEDKLAAMQKVQDGITELTALWSSQ